MNYETILKSISVGRENAPLEPMTKTEAWNLLLDIHSRMAGATTIKNQCFETSRYFIYIGEFPAVHVAIDNKVGTTRYFTLYSEQDFLNKKEKIVFVK